MRNTDAWLYIFIATMPTIGVCLGSDEAKGLIRADILFYLKSFVIVAGAGVTALKAYRSKPVTDQPKTS